MTRNALLCATLPAIMLLAGCGDDLDSRTEAAERTMAERAAAADAAEVVEEDSDDDVAAPRRAPARERADRDDDEETVVDASPDDLLDSTRGFAPEPLDNASGIDPAPLRPEPVG